MTNNVVDILKGVVSELREIAKSETVIGQPITVGKTTVLPVIKLSVGFGAGGGQGEDTKAMSGFGGGGGGGARIEPAEKGVRFLATGKGKWDSIIEAVPGIARKVSDWKDKMTSEKDKEDGGKSDKKHNENGDE